MIGRSNQCEGCPGQQYCINTAGEDPDQKQLDTRMKVITHKIIIMSGKGGVGKSTVTANIAVGLALKGYKVGILDVDICGPSIPRMMQCEGMDVISQPWGWIPVKAAHNISVMSIGFLSSSKDRKSCALERTEKDFDNQKIFERHILGQAGLFAY
jgi:Mrp family chromosome partitioning ATPase